MKIFISEKLKTGKYWFEFVFLLLTFSTLFSQNNTLTLQYDQIPLRQIIEDLGQKHQLRFIYKDALVDGKTITCDLEAVSLRFALRTIIAQADLDFELKRDGSVVLFRQKKALSAIRGQVLDATTRSPLQDVNVFLADTFMGSATNQAGQFEIQNIPTGIYQLIVHHIGYRVHAVNVKLINPESLVYDVQLQPHTIAMEEIKITASQTEKRKKDLEKFYKLFLGESENAKQCRILNPHVIEFFHRPETEEFIARSDSAIIVENHALGYRIHVFIDQFRWQSFSGIYKVYNRFEPIAAKNEQQMKYWMDNRSDTYQGSLKHFLASVAKGDVVKEGFSLYKPKYPIDGLYDLMEDSKSELTRIYGDELDILSTRSPLVKQLSFDDYIKTFYKHDIFASAVYINRESVLIDSLGNVADPLALTLFGKWSRKRIADMLPHDYQPNK